MKTILWILIGFVVSLVVALLFEESREWLEDAFEYIITFEWLEDIGEFFADGWEAITSIEDSPLTSVWFWLFFAALMAGVWFLPSKLGLLDYTLRQKIMYTIIFFVIDWFIVSHFQNS